MPKKKTRSGPTIIVLLLSATLAVILGSDAFWTFHAELLPNAKLKVLPASGTHAVGQDFTEDIVLDTGGETVGGVFVDVIYSSNLAFVKADPLGSVFDQEVLTPLPLRNHFQLASVRFDGGYKGAEGHIVRLTFKPLSPGNALVTIDAQASEVIAFADSSDVLGSTVNGSFTITGDAALPPACGNGSCESSETCDGCALDCGCGALGTCQGSTGLCIAMSTAGGGGGGGGGGYGGTLQALPGHGSPSEDNVRACLVPIPEGEILPSEAGKLLLTVNVRATIFRDVPINQWFARYVATIIRGGIASGYKDASGNLTGLYGPANSVTYAEIAKMALEMGGLHNLSGTGKLENSSALGQWSEAYIRLAEEKNLSVYVSSLNVNTAATRGAVIQTILEAMDLPIVHYEQNPYTDFSITHAHADVILTATTLGIVRGDTDALGRPLLRFRPDDPVNRAEVAKILVEAGRVVCGL